MVVTDEKLKTLKYIHGLMKKCFQKEVSLAEQSFNALELQNFGQLMKEFEFELMAAKTPPVVATNPISEPIKKSKK